MVTGIHVLGLHLWNATKNIQVSVINVKLFQ